MPRQAGFYFDLRHRRPLLRPVPFLPPASSQGDPCKTRSTNVINQSDVQGLIPGRFSSIRTPFGAVFRSGEKLRVRAAANIGSNASAIHSRKPLLKLLLSSDITRPGGNHATRTPSYAAASADLGHYYLRYRHLRHAGSDTRFSTSGCSTVSREEPTTPWAFPSEPCAVDFRPMRDWPPPRRSRCRQESWVSTSITFSSGLELIPLRPRS